MHPKVIVGESFTIWSQDSEILEEIKLRGLSTLLLKAVKPVAEARAGNKKERPKQGSG